LLIFSTIGCLTIIYE